MRFLRRLSVLMIAIIAGWLGVVVYSKFIGEGWSPHWKWLLFTALVVVVVLLIQRRIDNRDMMK